MFWSAAAIVLSLATALVRGPSAGADDAVLTAVVDGLVSSEGQVLVAVHASDDTFPDEWERAVAVARAPATAPSVTLTLTGIAPGRYAIIAVHDTDNSGAMTKNFIGFPREGYGSSNNPAILGPPPFNRSLIDLPASEPVRIQLNYL